jgi:hypothetical protein
MEIAPLACQNGKALNMCNKLNVTLGLTHLQHNAQQEKNI